MLCKLLAELYSTLKTTANGQSASFYFNGCNLTMLQYCVSCRKCPVLTGPPGDPASHTDTERNINSSALRTRSLSTLLARRMMGTGLPFSSITFWLTSSSHCVKGGIVALANTSTTRAWHFVMLDDLLLSLQRTTQQQAQYKLCEWDDIYIPSELIQRLLICSGGNLRVNSSDTETEFFTNLCKSNTMIAAIL